MGAFRALVVLLVAVVALGGCGTGEVDDNYPDPTGQVEPVEPDPPSQDEIDRSSDDVLNDVEDSSQTPESPAQTTCIDVTSYDNNWDNDMKCTRPDGTVFYTDYEGAAQYR